MNEKDTEFPFDTLMVGEVVHIPMPGWLGISDGQVKEFVMTECTDDSITIEIKAVDP